MIKSGQSIGLDQRVKDGAISQETEHRGKSQMGKKSTCSFLDVLKLKETPEKIPNNSKTFE